MRYHNITKDDMLNGDGLRVVLWLAGCDHHCKGCQNPLTWDANTGLLFDQKAWAEIENELKKDYIQGITFSGGDPLHPANRFFVLNRLSPIIKDTYSKTVWIYTGYLWEDIKDLSGLENVDVLVDGPFMDEFKDINYPWGGSTNQRVIDVQESLKTGNVILYKSN